MIDAGIRLYEAEDTKARRETEEKQFIFIGTLTYNTKHREREKSYNLFLFHIVKNCTDSLVREVLN